MSGCPVCPFLPQLPAQTWSKVGNFSKNSVIFERIHDSSSINGLAPVSDSDLADSATGSTSSLKMTWDRNTTCTSAVPRVG